ACLKYWVTRVSWREIKFLPESWMAVRDVMFAIFAKVAAIGVDDRSRIEINAGHFHFVDGYNHHHVVAFRQLLHAGHGGAVWHALGHLVPSRLLLGAEVRAVEKLLQAEDLHFSLCRRGDQTLVFADHFLFDLGQGEFGGRPFTARLNQAATDNARHLPPPEVS